mgnify:CR=1 FL=1
MIHLEKITPDNWRQFEDDTADNFRQFEDEIIMERMLL